VIDGKLRVLHLNAGNLYGGIESALANLARLQFHYSDFHFEFGLCFPGRHREELLEKGCRVHDLSPVRLSRPWTVWRARRRLAKLLSCIAPHLVTTHGSWIHSIAGPVVRKARLPLATWVHGTLDASSPLERLARKTQPDLLIANSRHTLTAAREVFPTCSAEVVYFPIESAYRHEESRVAIRRRVRERFGLVDDCPLVLQVGRMEPGKGHDDFIQALSQIPIDRPWQAWLVGGAQRSEEVEYESSLSELCHRLKLGSRVQMLGQRSDVSDLMAAADVFCLTNNGPESFGMVFVEALYAGLSVVTSNIGGGAEIVTSECGRLVAVHDVKGFSEAIQEFMFDGAKRRQCAVSAPRRADELCNPKRQMNKLYELLASHVSGR
jgi:glycosyltransferase involved in cell wall biosynthesis